MGRHRSTGTGCTYAGFLLHGKVTRGHSNIYSKIAKRRVFFWMLSSRKKYIIVQGVVVSDHHIMYKCMKTNPLTIIVQQPQIFTNNYNGYTLFKERFLEILKQLKYWVTFYFFSFILFSLLFYCLTFLVFILETLVITIPVLWTKVLNKSEEERNWLNHFLHLLCVHIWYLFDFTLVSVLKNDTIELMEEH